MRFFLITENAEKWKGKGGPGRSLYLNVPAFSSCKVDFIGIKPVMIVDFNFNLQDIFSALPKAYNRL